MTNRTGDSFALDLKDRSSSVSEGIPLFFFQADAVRAAPSGQAIGGFQMNIQGECPAHGRSVTLRQPAADGYFECGVSTGGLSPALRSPSASGVPAVPPDVRRARVVA